jgi:hypothetical protein
MNNHCKDACPKPAHSGHGGEWKIADVLDFEFLLAARDGEDEKARSRDREIYEKEIVPRFGADEKDRRKVFRAWLEMRRKDAEDAENILPGEQFTTAWQCLLTVAMIAGFLLGGSVTAAPLLYKTEEPLNVLGFLNCTLGLQTIILIGALLLWIVRSNTHFLDDWRPLRTLVGALLAIFNTSINRLPGEKRGQLRSGLAQLTRKRELYGALAAWQVLAIAQFFAVCFNVGILATFFFMHVLSDDLNFGWKTTINVRPETAARIVAFISVPWEKFPHAHPSAEQVIATRYAHNQSVKTLPIEAMRAWWPFLIYAVACYGLVVRGGLLLFAGVKLQRSLQGLQFDHKDANSLWRRLVPPIITSGSSEPLSPDSTSSQTSSLPHKGGCLALVAQEIEVNESEVRNMLMDRFGWQIHGIRPAKIDNRGESKDLFAEVTNTAQSFESIVLIVPAAHDPIVATKLFIEELVKATGDKEVLLFLMGDRRNGSHASVESNRYEIWRRFLNIHNLRVGIEQWT